jgi:hypothetical protein
MKKNLASDEDINLGSVGLLGELAVEMALVRNGWHTVRLDTARMASNADLLAIKGKKRISIQVKTTNAFKNHSHSKSLGFGYSTSYLRDGKSIFNSKESPLIADVVIGVSYHPTNTRFIVMPVAFAERLCKRHCDWWASIPTRTKTGKRSDSFPIYVCFSHTPRAHFKEHERAKRNLAHYENAWRILEEPIERLHNKAVWPLIK